MPVYLDYNATTPVDRSVLDAMLPYLTEEAGNASSIHSPGQHARAAVEAARESVALLLGANPAEIVFTSGGTEADNLALLGTTQASRSPQKHVVTTSIEHHAVLNTCEALEKRGVEITYVRVGENGIVDPQDVRRALRPETLLVSVMHANNETGAIQPVEAIGQIARDAGVYFHCDAVQSAGKLPVDVNRLKVDLLSVSAHKIYGPKGVGALYVRPGTPVEPQLFGGHQQRDLRPGTENVPGIVGLGKAAQLARLHRDEDSRTIAALRDRLEDSLLSVIGSVRVNGDRERRVSNTTNLAFAGAGGEALLIALDLLGLACSTGAACSSGAVEPSHVLTAMGLSSDQARSSLRFSLGRGTTAEEIDEAVAIIPRAVARIRALSPVSKTAVLTR
jgi:cysteine desulfurase